MAHVSFHTLVHRRSLLILIGISSFIWCVSLQSSLAYNDICVDSVDRGELSVYGDTTDISILSINPLCDKSPSLSFAENKGYGDFLNDPANTDPGVSPDSVATDADMLVFKVVYNDDDGDVPQELALRVTNADTGEDTYVFGFVTDHDALYPEYYDNIYDNGEQYVVTQTFPKGHYTYSFEVPYGLETVTLSENYDGAPLMFHVGGDAHAPTLTLPTETGYDDNGLYPNKGVANKDVLMFKAVYADEDETPADKVTATIDTTVHFDTDEFYPHHVSLSDKAVFVDSKNIHPGLATARLVGQKRNLLDGPNLSEGEILEIPLLRSHIRRATTTLVAVAEVFRFGDVNAEFVLEALGSSGDVIGHQSTTITLDPDVPFVDNIPLAVSADSDIASLRLTVLHANDTVGWLKNIMTEADMLMKNDGDGSHFTASGTFPKGVYTYVFTASSTDGLATRFPESGALSFTTGYSSVAFVPGIKASRLYFQGDVTENQLWEPNRDGDTQAIALNSDGTSGVNAIYTKTDPNSGLIDDVNLLQLWDPNYVWDPVNIVGENFYISFIDSMDKMVNAKEIAGWKALPYDWRLSFDQILAGGREEGGKIYYDRTYTTETPYVLEELRKLANNSDSGKMVIVAHSMGGLIVKKMLNDIEKDPNHPYRDLLSKVETVILVDSPQLGTPQAIASLLHGEGEDIPDNFGLFSSAETGRAIGQNMMSAYTLLPSQDYTTRVTDEGSTQSTLLQLDYSLKNVPYDGYFYATTTLGYYTARYGTTTISSYLALKDFLLGNDGHTSASDSDLKHPKVVRKNMLEAAQKIHDEIDVWQAPVGIRVVQIAGWGMPETIRGVVYKENRHIFCSPVAGAGSLPACLANSEFDVQPLFTYDGDGTVTLPSQTAMDVETYYVDLNAHNAYLKKNRSHGSILEVSDVRALVQKIIQNKIDPWQNLPDIKTNKSQLDIKNLDTLVRLSIHSPIQVDVYDKDGNHLGISASSTSAHTFFDEQMPNSYYLKFGEGTYLGFSLTASTTIQIKGTGTGTFTLEMEQYQGDTLQETQTFTNISVGTTTKATLILNTLSDAKELALDHNGDGKADALAFTDENKKTVTIQTLKGEIQTLSSKVQPAFLNQLVLVEKLMSKKNHKAAIVLFNVMKKEIEVLSRKKIDNRFQIEKEQALRLTSMIDVIIGEIK